MLIDLAGLLAAATLLVALIALEVKRVAADAGEAPRPRFLGRTVSRSAVVVLWAMFLVLFLPRMLALLA